LFRKEANVARILIVDDSLIMRRNLASILKEAGHTIVGEASNGQQAYLQYRRQQPDIVTMDITMPNVDGIDALKHIMAEDPSAKVVMISALDQRSKVYTALRNGAKHYILKPLTTEKIISVIDEVLEKESDELAKIEEENNEKISPFEVANGEEGFTVSIKQDLDYQQSIELMGAVNGFLYLSNPHIIFDFDVFEVKGEEALTKFDALLNKIRKADGTFQIRAKNPEFTSKIEVKDGLLEKTFDAGEFVLEDTD
jgi:DNA-binding NarL/FixJ family response regulator